MKRRALTAAIATGCLFAMALPGTAAAQAGAAGNWPNKPIRMIVPFPAGSFTDTVARVLSERLTKAMGQPVVVENKAGANGLIGVGEAARSAPDGYTLLVTNSSSVTINPHLYKKATYKVRDLTPVTLVLEAPFILVTNPDWSQKHAVATVPDLVRYASQNPGKISYGSAGPGNRAKIQTTHVPYKSAAQAEMAVISGELDTAFDTWTALPQIKAGKLKPLAVSSTRRMTQLPDVPTVEETGLKPFNSTFWIGLLAPAGTPQAIVQKLHAATRGVLEDEKGKAALSQQGDVVMIDPENFAKRVEKEEVSWDAVIQKEAITLD